MSDLITYDDKIRLKSQNVSEKYKVTASDMNEIKNVVNGNAEEVGDITLLTTTDKTSVVNAINELETDKLETSAVVNEASTDTNKIYSANYLNDKIFTAFENGTWTKNTTYVRNTGYMMCYKNNRLCYFNGNFRIDTVPTTKNEILFSNLPHPRTRVTTTAMVETTPVRLYIDTDGTLRNDSTNYITGWINFCCMYVL